MNNSQSKRVVFIDWLRALAIFLVVIYHLVESFWYHHQSIVSEIGIKPFDGSP